MSGRKQGKQPSIDDSKFSKLNISGSEMKSGSLLREFSNIEKLGSGGFGLVLQLRKKNEKCLTALKLTPLEGRKSYEETLAEAKQISGISKNDSVVSCVDYWIDQFTPAEHKRFVQMVKPNTEEPFHSFPENASTFKFLCIRMELCGKGNLKKFLKQRVELNPAESISIFLQIARGIEHIHEHNIIHRDLKPANILYNGKIAKISDFGYSVMHSPGEYYHTKLAGALLYRAPEQDEGKYGKGVDYYALGLILYELFYLPVSENVGYALKLLKYEKEMPKQFELEYPVVAGLIRELTRFKPEERLTSFDEIIEKMKGILDISTKPKEQEKKNSSTSCFNCYKSLKEARYRCSVCQNYWLCEICENKNAHTKSHNMIKIRDNALPNVDEEGCEHYNRKCRVQCPKDGCKRFFSCRFCHDDNIKGHLVDRCKVDTIQCNACGFKQVPRSACLLCETQFAKYCCLLCNLFDDSVDADQLIFHCYECGICRRRANKYTNYSHCEKCSMCYPISIGQDDETYSLDAHVCNKNAGITPCSVCHKDIHKSREAGVLVDCHHYVHTGCRTQFPDGIAKCPICGNW